MSAWEALAGLAVGAWDAYNKSKAGPEFEQTPLSPEQKAILDQGMGFVNNSPTRNLMYPMIGQELNRVGARSWNAPQTVSIAGMPAGVGGQTGYAGTAGRPPTDWAALAEQMNRYGQGRLGTPQSAGGRPGAGPYGSPGPARAGTPPLVPRRDGGSGMGGGFAGGGGGGGGRVPTMAPPPDHMQPEIPTDPNAMPGGFADWNPDRIFNDMGGTITPPEGVQRGDLGELFGRATDVVTQNGGWAWLAKVGVTGLAAALGIPPNVALQLYDRFQQSMAPPPVPAPVGSFPAPPFQPGTLPGGRP